MKVLVLLSIAAGVALSQGSTTTPPASSPVPAPSPATVAAPASVVEEPSQFFSSGAGISGLGPAQPFGYYSISQRIAEGTYATEITEFVRLAGGKVGTCSRAGVSKVLWRFSAFTIGLVGDAGGCEIGTGGVDGALSARSFMTARFGHTGFHFIGTVEDLKVAGQTTNGQRTIITLGIGYGLFK